LSITNKLSIILYADDILLMAPSLSELQRLFSVCESFLSWNG